MWGIVDTNVGSDLIQMWGQVRYKCGAPVDANVGPGSIQMWGPSSIQMWGPCCSALILDCTVSTDSDAGKMYRTRKSNNNFQNVHGAHIFLGAVRPNGLNTGKSCRDAAVCVCVCVCTCHTQRVVSAAIGFHAVYTVCIIIIT